MLPEPACPEIIVPGDTSDLMKAVRDAVRTLYNIGEDDARMREMLRIPAKNRSPLFRRLRASYPVRREFFNTRAIVTPPNPELETLLAGIGFER